MATNINIGRSGWAGIALEATPGVGVSPTDYLQFTANTLQGMVKNIDISNATQNRLKVFNSVQTEKWGAGDLEFYADPKYMGYFIVAALGSVATVGLGGGVYQHTVNVDNSNTAPQTLTIINDRLGALDQEAYYSSTVDTFSLALTDGVATCKTTLMSLFPQTTASGSATTASGTVYAFPSSRFAFGTSVANADVNAFANNIKTHDFGLEFKNNSKMVFRHGNSSPDTINSGDFEATASFKLYFENTTDRNSYYNSAKQAAEFVLQGAALGGGNVESTKFRYYLSRIDSFALETGLSNFFIEDVKLQPETDNVSGKMVDVVIINNKTLYI